MSDAAPSKPFGALEAAPLWTPVRLDGLVAGALYGVRFVRGPASEAAAETVGPAARAAATTFGPARRAEFFAGRLALGAACAALGRPIDLDAPPRTPRGAPTVPRGIAASVAHKDDVAVALARQDDGSCVGLDLEVVAPDRLRAAPAVLLPAESEALAAAPASRRSVELLVRFAVKEAIYKAVDPLLPDAGLAFDSVAVRTVAAERPGRFDRAALDWTRPRAVDVTADVGVFGERILAVATARRRGDAP